MNILSTTPIETRDSCGTPKIIMDLVRDALGGTIDLDPCSNPTAQQIVGAKTYWTIDDDCLAQDWSQHAGANKSLWVNPPYSAQAMRNIVPMVVEHAPAFGRGAVVLVNAISDTSYGQQLMDACDVVLYPKRINFEQQSKSNPHRQMFCVWGHDVAEHLGHGLDSIAMMRSRLDNRPVRDWTIRMLRQYRHDDETWERVRQHLMTYPTSDNEDDFHAFFDMMERGEQVA